MSRGKILWCAVISRMKYIIKMTQVIKATLIADLSDVVFVGEDQLTGIYHTLTVDILCGRHLVILLKGADHVSLGIVA